MVLQWSSYRCAWPLKMPVLLLTEGEAGCCNVGAGCRRWPTGTTSGLLLQVPTGNMLWLLQVSSLRW